jgi:hypothetical protein
MRSFAFVLITTLASCSDATVPHLGEPDAGTPTDGPLAVPARGFQIVSPTITVDPRAEVTYCYYFRAPNKTALQIKKWGSRMTRGLQHAIVYLTAGDKKTPGTVSTEDCRFLDSGMRPIWSYAANTPDAELALPADDGSGVPVGQPIRAMQSGYLQLHFANDTDDPLPAHIELNAYAHDEGITVTPAAPFVTYNNEIDLAPGSPTSPTANTVGGTCDVTELGGGTLTFYLLSTHSYRQSVHTSIKDGAMTVLDSRSWEHPVAASWRTAPFYTFASGSLTYECEYSNPNNRTIRHGENPAKDEVCMTIGYYFPASSAEGHYCLNRARIY